MLLTYLPLCVIVAVVSKKSIHKIYLFITIKKGILIPISLLTPEKEKNPVLLSQLSHPDSSAV